MLASGSGDCTALLKCVETGDFIRRLNHDGDPLYNDVLGVAFSSDGETLASAAPDNRVQLWNVKTGICTRILKGHTDTVECVAFLPTNDNILASGSIDKTVCLWDCATTKCIVVLRDHNGAVSSVAFSPNGKLLASASYDKTVRLWNVESTECISVLHDCNGWVRSVAFSPNGKLLASASDDHTVRVWSTETSTLKTVYKDSTQDGDVLCVAFSPGGKTLAVGSCFGAVQLIPLLDSALCRLSLLLHIGVAPYVLLDIANLCIANNKRQCIDEEAAFLHFEKVSLLERLQARIKK